MLKHYLIVAFRNLWKYRVQNFLGITGLSLGFLCFSIVVFDIEWDTSYDTEYPGAKRMYVLRNEHHSDYNGNIYNLNQALPEVEKITVFKEHDYQSSYFMLDTVKSQYHSFGLFECDTAFIDFFSLKILVGNKYAINNTVNSIVLFDADAREIDGKLHSVIGKTIQSGDEKFQITGIVKKPLNSHIMDNSDGFIINRESGVFRDEIYNKWNNLYQTYIMLKNNVSEKKFKETLSNRRFDFTLHKERLGLTKTEDGNYVQKDADVKDERFVIKPLNDPLERRTVTHYLERFLIGLLILLTTLFNYTSFQTSQFYNRLRECALRRTAGAGKKDLFFLFFSEIIIAFVIVYFVSLLFLHLFKGYIPEVGFYLPDINIIQVSMLKYLIFVLLTASVLYLIPVNIIHRMSIRTVFLGISQKGKKGTVRNLMLFFQFAVLLLFLSAFAIVGLQTDKYRTLLFNHLPKEDRMNILYTFCYDKELNEHKDVIIREIASSSLVNSVLPSSEQIITHMFMPYNGTEIPNFHEKMIGYLTVEPAFFDFFHCQLLAG
jgi:hypothetical protein